LRPDAPGLERSPRGALHPESAATRLAFVVDRPTQFDAPFFRFVAAAAPGSFLPLFADPRAREIVRDAELDRAVDWGVSLFDGYPSDVRVDHESVDAWLGRAIGAKCPDVLVINGYTRPEYRAALAWANARRIPAALRIDSTTVDRAPWRRWAKRLLFASHLRRRFRWFLATSSRTERYLEAFGVPSGRIARFPYAVDETWFREQAAKHRPHRAEVRAALELPADAAVVLVVSKLGPRETPWDLVALPALDGSQPFVVVAGDGPERGPFEAAARARFGDRFRALGYVPYPRLPSLYAMSDVFLHAPREERWGVSVAEALACSLPVVAADTVGAGEDLIRAGGNGEVYPLGDAAELARALSSALALDATTVDLVSREPLDTWGYAASWASLRGIAGGSADGA
jgi:glycosyltransferase involved in cell wall biosynthesis